MFKLFSNSERRHNQPKSAPFSLLDSIPSCVSNTRNLDSRLDAIAKLLVQLPGLSGAMVIGCDSTSLPIAYGLSKFSLEDKGSVFSHLESLELMSRSHDSWFSVKGKTLAFLAGSSFKARKIVNEDGTLGIIVVQIKIFSAQSALQQINQSLGYLTWAISDGLRLEAHRLSEDFQDLMLTDLGRLGPVQPQQIAQRLQAILHADAVTILAREFRSLYLSGTTDTELAKNAGDLAVGLTEQILVKGQSVRLRNARDEQEIHEQFTLDSKIGAEMEHPEEMSRDRRPFRLLAVLMRSGQAMDPRMRDFAGKTVEAKLDTAEDELGVRGIVRILRKQDSPPFSIDELKNLQCFADLLALALYAASWLDVTKRVIKAKAEAVCITHRNRNEDAVVNKVVYADPGAERLFGLNSNKLIGLDARRLYVGDEEFERINTLLSESLKTGNAEFGPVKARIRVFNSRVQEERLAKISYRFLKSPVLQSDTYYTLAVIRDITEDQHLSKLLDQKGLAYFRADIEGSTVETSEAESQLTGYSTRELLKMDRRDLYVIPEDRDKLLERVHKADGNLVEARERLKKKNDDHFWAEGVIHLLKDANGLEIGYEGLYDDVTDRLKLQRYIDMDSEKLLEEGELYLKLKESARLQLLLMTSLGHQLGSPLSALTETLKSFRKKGADTRRFAERIKYAVGQTTVCAQLVANLTYMDLLLKGDSLDFRPVSLSQLAIDTKLNFAHLAQEKNLRILVLSDEIDKRLKVWGHEGLLRQVFVNLVDNAVKYSSPGSRIIIGAKEGVENNYLQVSNRGIGVPPGSREEIFFQGVRLNKAKMAVPDGTGLGLWLVRRILASHQAEIVCDEVFERGSLRTAFQIFFPSKPIKRSFAGWRTS